VTSHLLTSKRLQDLYYEIFPSTTAEKCTRKSLQCQRGISLYARTSQLLGILARRLTAISPAKDLDSDSVYLHQSAAASRESGLRDGAGGSIHIGFAFAQIHREAILLAIPLRLLSYPRPGNRVLTKHTVVHERNQEYCQKAIQEPYSHSGPLSASSPHIVFDIPIP
jgi:hypothetical protein